MRDLDRERSNLERQEGKLKADIKKMANAGQMDAAKIMAKDLVRTRAQARARAEATAHRRAWGERRCARSAGAAARVHSPHPPLRHARRPRRVAPRRASRRRRRLRAQVRKFYKLRGHLQAVSLRLQTLQSNATMAQAMRGVTKAMAQMNRWGATRRDGRVARRGRPRARARTCWRGIGLAD